MYTLGIDIGGTFTDLTLVDERDGGVAIEKEPTTQENPAVGALDGTRRLLEQENVSAQDVSSVIHGTTLVSNTIIELTGAKTGLITTEGFRDTLLFRRGSRYDMFDWDIEYPEPLVPRERRIEVSERVDDDGNVLTALDPDEVRDVADHLVEDHGADSIAVSLLHSYVNSEHEETIGEIIRERHPDVNVSLSSTIVPVIREYERTSTTVINAYVAPVVDEYLDFLESQLREEGYERDVYLMTSSGGIVDIETAREQPVHLVESGPAAGVLASRIFGESHGAQDVFSFDMGGTTAKGSVVDQGELQKKYQTDIARKNRFKEGSGYEIISPQIDIMEIGAGGGSIASVNEIGLVEVGPESAGSDPGPICYDQGGEKPTVTDASLILGYLNPENFYGGRIDLGIEKTRRIFREELADPLDVSIREAAWRVFEAVNENMTTAFRRHAASQGLDTRGLSVTALGGAGPSHAYRIARKLNFGEVICPFGAGVGSSIGLTAAPRMYETRSTRQAVVNTLDQEAFESEFRPLYEEAREILARANVDEEQMELSLSLDMRHVDQGHEIKVPLPGYEIDEVTVEAAIEHFERTYQEMFNRATLDYPIEVLNYRLELRESVDSQDAVVLREPGSGSADPDSRAVYFGDDHGAVETDVYQWTGMTPGSTVDGPVVIEADQTTVVADPESTVSVEDNYDVRITLQDQSE